MDGDVLPAYAEDFPEVVDRLPENFGDDLISKPACQRQWRWDQQHGIWGFVDPSDRRAWLRHLDYYVRLHELADESLGTVLAALEAWGRGTTRSSCSPPTTATCAGPTACGPRARSSTTRS